METKKKKKIKDVDVEGRVVTKKKLALEEEEGGKKFNFGAKEFLF